MDYKVIVSINNENQIEYIKLFKDAYDFLVEKSNDPDVQYTFTGENEYGTFTSLNEYYAHMADFFALRNYKHIMLPLDEAPLEIDLNSRNIKVPSDFNKCASVQKDQLAELVIFTVDRYFDYMDLANTHIYVQWTTPADKEGIIHEGATRIEMIDLETYPGQLRFAWPLTEEITSIPGNVKFSVRFFRLKNDNDFGNEDNIKNLVYSLNTTEASIGIKAALQPDLTSFKNVEEPVTDNAFKFAVVNSLYSDSGLIPPKQPEFREPGSNLFATTGALKNGQWVGYLEDNTITMYVQAVTADTGILNYKWMYTDDNGNHYNDCESENFGNISHNVYLALTTDQMKALAQSGREINARYYTQDLIDTESYNEFTEIGDDFLLALADWKDDSIAVEDKAILLYEKYSAFTVPESGTITGTYQANVTNTVSNGTDTMTTVNPSYSIECLLPPPIDIAYEADKNLPEYAILDPVTNSVNIGLVLIRDNNNAKITYQWKKSITSESEGFEDIPDNNIANYIAIAPGWYTVDISAELNRTTKTSENAGIKVCKVTGMPVAPTVQYEAEDGTYVDGTVNNLRSFEIDFNQTAALKVKASVPNEDNLATELVHDFYTYDWYIKEANGEWSETPLKGNEKFVDSIVNDIDTSTLTVKNTSYVNSFRCVVTNHLNDQTAVYDHGVDNDANTDFTFIVINKGAVQ